MNIVDVLPIRIVKGRRLRPLTVFEVMVLRDRPSLWLTGLVVTFEDQLYWDDGPEKELDIPDNGDDATRRPLVSR